MAYVGYSSVANLALTYPAQAEGVNARASEVGEIGEHVAGSEVIWMGEDLIDLGYILMENTRISHPRDYVLEENSFRIRLETI